MLGILSAYVVQLSFVTAGMGPLVASEAHWFDLLRWIGVVYLGHHPIKWNHLIG